MIKVKNLIILLLLVGFIFFIVGITLLVVGLNVNNSGMNISGIIFIVIFFIFNLTKAIKILTFPNPMNDLELSTYKTLWGILSVVVPFLPAIIFLLLTNKYIRNVTQIDQRILIPNDINQNDFIFANTQVEKPNNDLQEKNKIIKSKNLILLFLLLSMISFIIGLTLVEISLSTPSYYYDRNMYIVGMVFLFIFVMFNLITGAKIITYPNSTNNSDLNVYKITWGILTAVIFSFLTAIIFLCLAAKFSKEIEKNENKKIEPEVNHNYSNQNKNLKQENFKHICQSCKSHFK
ncbi:hypothetical protein [Mycoplasmoides pirum]|uniref:hypothetical protein n=1 Tax=Mycoplasmoides pirum TaxID=2122 RepID=UPI000482EE08|nr:hypothetical protein [Mycoplasmoides pirum]